MAKYWFDHVHLTINNPETTAGFYEKMFGAKREEFDQLPDGRTLVSVAFDGAFIKTSQPRPEPLIPNTLPEGFGLEHFGLATLDDLPPVEEFGDLMGDGSSDDLAAALDRLPGGDADTVLPLETGTGEQDDEGTARAAPPEPVAAPADGAGASGAGEPS